MPQILKSNSLPKTQGPLILCILDGIAYSKCDIADAYKQAYTPNLDWLHKNCINRSLIAHGTSLGLPNDNDMGNSEVGHNAIGGGRIVNQGAKLVNNSIVSQELFKGDTWKKCLLKVKKHDSCLHFIGLLSDGNVHSHINHLIEMIKNAHKQKVKKIRIHILLDGRDVSEISALKYVDILEDLLSSMTNCDYKIASGGGRMLLTMDRYNAEWNMVETGWHTHVLGKARFFPSATTAIKTYRKELKCTDQYIPAFVISENNKAIGEIHDNDSVIFFNFRGDRSIEISKAFEDEDFPYFNRIRCPKVFFTGMMQYDGDQQIPKNYLVSPPIIKDPLGSQLAYNGITQFAISETQKYGHITFFFNGNKSGKFDDKLEHYTEIDSFLPPFDNNPQMKAKEITDIAIKEIKSQRSKFIRINYPNGDMIGHTGNFKATKFAVECVDKEIKRLIDITQKAKGILIVTADHGNCDEMYEIKNNKILLDENGNNKIKTSHSLNPVPFIIYNPSYSNNYQLSLDKSMSIGNIGSTCLDLLGFQKPEFYSQSIIKINS